MNNRQYSLFHNIDLRQFEFHIDGYIAKIAYTKTKDTLNLFSTKVPKELEGREIASQLAEQVFNVIENEKLTIIPTCPFIIAYIKKHPEWKRLVSSEFKND